MAASPRSIMYQRMIAQSVQTPKPNQAPKKPKKPMVPYGR